MLCFDIRIVLWLMVTFNAVDSGAWYRSEFPESIWNVKQHFALFFTPLSFYLQMQSNVGSTECDFAVTMDING